MGRVYVQADLERDLALEHGIVFSRTPPRYHKRPASSPGERENCGSQIHTLASHFSP
jgi:hypothetical protein